MNDRSDDKTTDPNATSTQPKAVATLGARAPYEAPRITKKRSVARVTLLSGMGAAGMGVISVMN
jgi:hypothetical protein